MDDILPPLRGSNTHMPNVWDAWRRSQGDAACELPALADALAKREKLGRPALFTAALESLLRETS